MTTTYQAAPGVLQLNEKTYHTADCSSWLVKNNPSQRWARRVPEKGEGENTDKKEKWNSPLQRGTKRVEINPVKESNSLRGLSVLMKNIDFTFLFFLMYKIADVRHRSDENSGHEIDSHEATKIQTRI